LHGVRLTLHPRLRQLKDEPYSQKEAEAAAGLTTNNGRETEKMAIDEDVLQDASAALIDPAACLIEPEQHQIEIEAIR